MESQTRYKYVHIKILFYKTWHYRPLIPSIISWTKPSSNEGWKIIRSYLSESHHNSLNYINNLLECIKWLCTAHTVWMEKPLLLTITKSMWWNYSCMLVRSFHIVKINLPAMCKLFVQRTPNHPRNTPMAGSNIHCINPPQTNYRSDYFF